MNDHVGLESRDARSGGAEIREIDFGQIDAQQIVLSKSAHQGAPQLAFGAGDVDTHGLACRIRWQRLYQRAKMAGDKQANNHGISNRVTIQLMRFDIFTLFPGIFESPLKESMLKRAIESGLLDVQLHNIRDYAEGRHQVTDDYPYGGGGGMVMKPEPVFAAVESVLGSKWDWNRNSNDSGANVQIRSESRLFFSPRKAASSISRWPLNWHSTIGWR